MAIPTGAEMRAGMANYMDELVRRGRSCGFGPNPGGPNWYDQVFERDLDPAVAGKTVCETPLRVGSTNNRLDVMLVCAYDDDLAKQITVNAGSKVTVTMMEGDSPDGPFTAVGPTVCVTAPAHATVLRPGEMIARFPIGNMTRPWAKVEIEFDGGITGGLVDVRLVNMPY